MLWVSHKNVKRWGLTFICVMANLLLSINSYAAATQLGCDEHSSRDKWWWLTIKQCHIQGNWVIPISKSTHKYENHPVTATNSELVKKDLFVQELPLTLMKTPQPHLSLYDLRALVKLIWRHRIHILFPTTLVRSMSYLVQFSWIGSDCKQGCRQKTRHLYEQIWRMRK